MLTSPGQRRKAEFLFTGMEARGVSLDRVVEAAGRGANSKGRPITKDGHRLMFFKLNRCKLP